MTFGEAIQAMKNGKIVQRAGWNGKNMALYLVNGAVCAEEFMSRALPHPSDADPDGMNDMRISGISVDLFDGGPAKSAVRMPCVAMRTADGCVVTGWLASQTDMLAEDWSVLE